MSDSAVQPPLGEPAPGNGRARELADAVVAFDRLKAQAEAGRLCALLGCVEAYQISEPTGDGCEAWVQVGHDGTPLVAEFGLLEVGPLVGMSQAQVQRVACRGLDLKYRLPKLWDRVMACDVEVWKGLKVAELTADLHHDVVAELDKWIGDRVACQPWGRVERSVRRWVDATDPRRAHDKAETRQCTRRVAFGPVADGDVDVFAQLSAQDGTDLDAAITAIADTLPVVPGRVNDVGVRRAAALGILARQAFGHDALPTHSLVVHVERHRSGVAVVVSRDHRRGGDGGAVGSHADQRTTNVLGWQQGHCAAHP